MRATAQEIERVIRLARRSPCIVLATVDEAGAPTFTPVQECRLVDETAVSIKAWTDIPPAESRDGESKVAMLIWNARDGRAYQIAGHVVRSQTTAILNGLAEIEEHEHFPQVQREILMQVDAIEDLQFTAREKW